MNKQPDFESIIQERLDELKSVPARNPQVAAHARARFLAHARSANEARYRKGWAFSFRKQQFALNLIVTVLVIAGLFIGGGTTVRAAQDDLPNEPLYAIKTLSEDVSLRFQTTPEAKVDRLLELTQTRIQEMTRLIETGQPLPERVSLRLEQHLQQTLQLCSSMDDTKLDQKLVQVREKLQQYDRDIQSLQVRAVQGEQPVLERTHTMLQTELQLVDAGLLDRESFRNTIHNSFHYGQTQTSPAPSQSHGEQNGQTTSQPGNQGNGNGVGPNADPGGQNLHLTPGNNGNNSDPGNNADGNDKNKDADNKDSNKNKSNGNDSSEGKSKGKGHQR